MTPPRSTYRTNDRDPASSTIYRFDVKTRAKQLVFDQPGRWAIVDHRGDEWLLANDLGPAHVEIWSYDLATKRLRPLLGITERAAYQAAFGPRAGELVVRTDKRSEHPRLYTFEHDTLAPIGPELAHDIDGFALDRARRRLYYAVNEDGRQRLAVLDTHTWRPIVLPVPPAADATTLASLSATGRFAALGIAGAAGAPATFVYDWTTQRLVQWRAPETPELDARTLAKPALESFTARDGVAIPMFVRRPARCVHAATPCPVVVEFHDGPGDHARPTFSPYAQAFTDAGFIYVQPDVRGSAGHGTSWLHADDGANRLDVLTDIEDCAKYLRRAWTIDGVAPRLGVVGRGPYGGYSALIAMTLYAGAYDAAVAQDGITSLATFLAHAGADRRADLIAEYGDPVKDKVALAKLSPLSYADRIAAPLLVLANPRDPRVPVGEALQFHGALARRRLDGGMLVVSGDRRGASTRADRVLALGHTLAFLERHLR